MTLTIPDRQIRKAELKIGFCVGCGDQLIGAREKDSLVGQLISMKLVLGGVCCLMTRAQSMQISEVPDWEASIRLSHKSIEQLRFWNENIRSHRSKMLYRESFQRKRSQSGWKDVQAIVFVLRSFYTLLQSERLKWFTDNMNAMSIVEKDSMKHDLQGLAKAIFDTCIRKHIYLEVEWIPRWENEKVDYLS